MSLMIGDFNVTKMHNELKRLKPLAVKFVSDLIQSVKNGVNELTKLNGDNEEANTLIDGTLERLEDLKMVSEVFNIEYYLPYCSDYSNNLDEVLSLILEENCHSDIFEIENFDDLMKTLRDMEYNSKKWHESRC